MRTIFLAVLVAACIALPARADWNILSDYVATVQDAQTVAASAVVTAVIQTGLADKHSLDWGITTTGSLNVTVLVDYSASELAATSANWASLSGSAYTTSFTITASPRLYVLNLAPIRYTRFRFTNADTVPATISWLRMFRR